MNTVGKIKVVLFDLGDTLIYFDGDWSNVLNRSTKALWISLNNSGIRVDPDTFIFDFSKRMRLYYGGRDESLEEYTTANVLIDTLSQYGIQNIPSPVIVESLKEMYSISQKHWKIESDTVFTLDWLKNNGYRLGLISNASDSEDVFTLLKQHKIEGYFEKIVVSANFGMRKPHPSIFLSTLEFFSVKPEQSLMVGDKLTMDILGANNIGMKTAWITRRINYEQRKLIDEIHPTIEITNLSDLISHLEPTGKI
jgi:HAD superfamily hydrolase (TIGR01662 family)